MIEIERDRRAGYLLRCRLLVALCVLTAGWYLWWLLFDAPPSSPLLFRLLMAAELFNIVQACGFWYTISIQRWTDPPPVDFSRSSETVDAFITVCGEPPEVVAKTVAAAAAMRHPRLTVWVLDDGASPEIERIAAEHAVRYLTRPDRRGAKAGNINDALARSRGDFVVIFDADHVPLPSFLERTIGVFADPTVAYVQTPQDYRNRERNLVAAGAHEQQALFYGPILRGKNGVGAVFSCGTNVVFRRTAIESVGGMPEDSVTEDLRVSLMLVNKGWRSEYVSETLAHGLGPLDVRGFFSQQRRWAIGSLQILMRGRPFSFGMGLGRFIQYSLSFLYWFNGWAYSCYITLTLAFLLLGLRPVLVRNEYPIHFLPYVFATIFTMLYATSFTLTFRGVWFTLASFPVQIGAFFTSLLGGQKHFVVTSKAAQRSSLAPVVPQLVVLVLLIVSVPIAVVTQGLTPSVVNNIAFACGHMIIVSGFVGLALDPVGPMAREAESKRNRAAREARMAPGVLDLVPEEGD